MIRSRINHRDHAGWRVSVICAAAQKTETAQPFACKAPGPGRRYLLRTSGSTSSYYLKLAAVTPTWLSLMSIQTGGRPEEEPPD